MCNVIAHPYDPFHHDEYYKFLAYFNNTRDEDVPGEYPLLREYNDSLKGKVTEVIDWVSQHATPEEAKKFEKFLRTWQPYVNSTTADSTTNAVITGNNHALAMRNHAVSKIETGGPAGSKPNDLEFLLKTKRWRFKNKD